MSRSRAIAPARTLRDGDETPAFLVGVDVGGTAIKFGAVTPAGRVLANASLPVDPEICEGDAEQVFATLATRILEIVPGAPSHVGVGLPGLLDRAAGTVLDSPNLPWLTGVQVRALLARFLGVPGEHIRIENDANVAALGERWLGAARGEPDALVVTLGTGIGGGLLLDGELVRGAGLAGEIGHVKIEPGGLRCGCGACGCLETLASARAASRRAHEAQLPPSDPGDLEALSSAARAAEGPERTLLVAVGRDLGHGLAAAIALLDLRCLVFAGGFSAALDLLEPGIRAGLSEWVWGDRVAEIRILRAELGAGAGWTGAAHLALP